MEILNLLSHFNKKERLSEDHKYETVSHLFVTLMICIFVRMSYRIYKNIFDNNYNVIPKAKVSIELSKPLSEASSLVAAFLRNNTAILLEITAYPSSLLNNRQFFKLITKICETIYEKTEKISKRTNQEYIKVCFEEDQIKNMKYEGVLVLDLLEIFEKSLKPIVIPKRVVCFKAKQKIHLSTHVYSQIKSFDNIVLGYRGGIAIFRVYFEELHLKYDDVCNEVCKHIVLNEKNDRATLMETCLNNTEFKVSETLRSNGLELIDYQSF